MMFPVVYAKCRQCFLVCLAEVSLFPGLSFTSKSNQEKKNFLHSSAKRWCWQQAQFWDYFVNVLEASSR